MGISKEQFLRENSHYQNSDIPNSVLFKGRVSHDTSLSYLKESDCSLIIREPTRTNNAGFPTKFVEAVALGIDVIATDVSDLGEYATMINNVYIVHDELYETMEAYIKEFNRKPRNRNSVFDYRKWNKKLCAFFDNCLN